MRISEIRQAPAIGLGVTQIIGWGSALYFPAAMGQRIARSLGTGLEAVFAGVSAMYVVGALLAPWVGRQLDARGARLVMTIGSIVAGCGFALLSNAHTLYGYVGAWLLLGGMAAAALSNTAYAALAQADRSGTKRSFTILVFATGLAATFSLPAIYCLGNALGWRSVALAAAALHLLVCAPLHWTVLPRQAAPDRISAASSVDPGSDRESISRREEANGAFAAIAVALSFNVFVTTGLALHLFGILTAIGFSQPTTIMLVSAIGPIQVDLRALQIIAANRVNPLISGLVGATALPVALGVLGLSRGGHESIDVSFASGFVVLFSISNALMVVARAAIPYAMFGPVQFGGLTGRLSVSQNLASALTPVAFACALENWHAKGALFLAFTASMVSLAALVILMTCRHPGFTRRNPVEDCRARSSCQRSRSQFGDE